MDSKKANLTPELKEIYDRVMNTSAQAKPPATNPPTQPTPQATQAPIVNSIPTPPNPLQPQTPQPSMPSLGTPIPPPDAAPSTQPQMPQMPGMPSVSEMNPAEEALTSAPARPLNEGGTFALNGKANSTQQKTKGEKKKMAISKPLLIFLGVAFIVVWGVFWAIIFGFIQR